MSPLKQTKLEKEEIKDNQVTTGKDKEVIDLSLDEEAANTSNEGNGKLPNLYSSCVASYTTYYTHHTHTHAHTLHAHINTHTHIL